MYQLNRGAIFVKRKQAFVDWVNKTTVADNGEELSLEAANSEPGVYMIPPFEGEKEFKDLLPQALDCIWEAELSGWNHETSLWPKDQSSKMFYQWFSLVVSGVVYDLLEDPLEKEEV